MNTFRTYFVLLVILLLNGCSTRPLLGPSFNKTEMPSIRKDAALVYLYSVGKGNEYRYDIMNISVDGNDVLDITNNAFTTFYIKPGPHQFVAEWPFSNIMNKPLFEDGHFDPKTLSVTLEAGEKYYINYFIEENSEPATTLETSSLAGKAFSKSHIIFAGLVEEDETTAISKLSTCSYLKNEIDQ